MAPEYARHGKLSMKLDVFSFGVIVLEIVSGQKNGGFRNGENAEHLSSFAWKNWRKGTAANIIDPTLNNALRDEIMRCIQIGLLCVQEKVADRPTMASVVLMLDSHSSALPVPLQPAYFMNNRCSSDIQYSGCSSVEIGSNEQKSDSADASVNEASISSLHPRYFDSLLHEITRIAAMAIVSKTLLLVLILLVILLPEATAQPGFVNYRCIDKNGNYTANSTFQANLKTLLSNLSSNTNIDYGFYNVSKGQNSDKVNAIGMCRGDLKAEACRSCLNNSRVLLTRLCPNQKEAIGWYDQCMLRYSTRSIFGNMEFEPSYYIWNKRNAPTADEFNVVVDDLLTSLGSRAAKGDSKRKYAEAKKEGPSFQTIFAHVQCTPDLSELQCNQCLFRAITYIPTCCASKVRVRIFKPSCNLRLDTIPYFDPTTDVSPSPTPLAFPSPFRKGSPHHMTGMSNSRSIVIAIIVPIVSIMILVTFTTHLNSHSTGESESEPDYEIEPTETLQFDFQTIIDATNNFADANKLGQGGFGPVYKGTLPNGEEVAIKRLSRGSGQGDIEFKNELLLGAKLQHRNLVRLLGFCLETGERIIVYEFLPHKSLDSFIFDPVKRLYLDWESRYKIIGGIAKGILYLHEDSRLCIIHRDIKASNVLLDEKMNPKISDFGMAKLFVIDQTLEKTNRVVGTQGYMAPEYVKYGHFSRKSDAWRNWREGNALNIVDRTLHNNSRDEIMRCIHIGLLCVEENLANRPTMATVVIMLNSYSLALPVPSQPAYSVNVRGPSDTGLDEPRNNPMPASEYEASISELDPR
ncbi:Cysteine-rich receptor-like protein kinase 26, partial [Mucuna pruriens]